jgi:hypothetical protein
MKNNNKGNILGVTSILLTVIIILGTIFVSIVIQGQLHLLNIERITQAYYTAEIGIERTKPYWNSYITLNHIVGDTIEIKEAEGSAENNSYVQSVFLKYLDIGYNYAVISITAAGECGNNKEIVVRTLIANFSNGTLISVSFLNEKNIAENYQQVNLTQNNDNQPNIKEKQKKKKKYFNLNVLGISSVEQ